MNLFKTIIVCSTVLASVWMLTNVIFAVEAPAADVLVSNRVLQGPSARPPVIVPSGPPSQLYLDHLYLKSDYKIVLNNTELQNFASTHTFNEIANWAPYIQNFIDEWRQRVHAHRLNMQDTVPETLHSNNLKAALQEISDIKGKCSCDCDAKKSADHAVVIPMPSSRYNESWPTLESIVSQIKPPKEIIFVLTEVTTERYRETMAYLNVIVQEYVPRIASSTAVRVYSSPSTHYPNDNRWFGFNQTTAGLVSFFDGDDYMHPRFTEFIDKVFTLRPELDFALVQYADGAITPKYNTLAYDDAISTFIKKYEPTSEKINRVLDYTHSEYQKLRDELPTWNKSWYLGNTDAEPNWRGEEQRWWDYGCHNGWVSFRREVLENVFPPVKKYGGEDAIFNYRVAKSGYNYHCMPIPLGLYIKCFCGSGRHRPLTHDPVTYEDGHLPKNKV